jgi:hypothetical protein
VHTCLSRKVMWITILRVPPYEWSNENGSSQFSSIFTFQPLIKFTPFILNLNIILYFEFNGLDSHIISSSFFPTWEDHFSSGVSHKYIVKGSFISYWGMLDMWRGHLYAMHEAQLRTIHLWILSLWLIRNNR